MTTTVNLQSGPGLEVGFFTRNRNLVDGRAGPLGLGPIMAVSARHLERVFPCRLQAFVRGHGNCAIADDSYALKRGCANREK